MASCFFFNQGLRVPFKSNLSEQFRGAFWEWEIRACSQLYRAASFLRLVAENYPALLHCPYPTPRSHDYSVLCMPFPEHEQVCVCTGALRLEQITRHRTLCAHHCSGLCEHQGKSWVVVWCVCRNRAGKALWIPSISSVCVFQICGTIQTLRTERVVLGLIHWHYLG